jgi:uncharacterized YccA/Bax inhibitor family protein
MIKRELETHLGADHVVVEEFSLAPGAFLNSGMVSTLLMLVAFILNISIRWNTALPAWVTATLGLVFSISALLLYVFEFVLGCDVIDRFFKCVDSTSKCNFESGKRGKLR